MKKNFATKSLIIMIAAFIIGLMLIFYAGPSGEKAGHKAIDDNGGAMDPSQYDQVVNTTIHNFQIAGGVISLIGGCGLLMSGYALYKEV